MSSLFLILCCSCAVLTQEPRTSALSSESLLYVPNGLKTACALFKQRESPLGNVRWSHCKHKRCQPSKHRTEDALLIGQRRQHGRPKASVASASIQSVHKLTQTLKRHRHRHHTCTRNTHRGKPQDTSHHTAKEKMDGDPFSFKV